MTTARELLKQIHTAKGELPPSLLAQIGAYLGEPVHVGDTITIKPSKDGFWKAATYVKNDDGGFDQVFNDDAPSGLEYLTHNDTYEDREGVARPFSYREYKFPEAGEARYLNGTDYNGFFVVEIHGRRFRVDMHIDVDEDDFVPKGVVTFTRTDEPLTDFATWNHDAAVAERRVRLVEELAANEAELAADPMLKWAKYTVADIERNKKDIADCDAGETRLQHPFYIQVFGQPHFIQNEIYPVHNGRSAMCLASIETGWGDSGNVNVLFACDEDGLPCRIWTEASCWRGL